MSLRFMHRRFRARRQSFPKKAVTSPRRSQGHVDAWEELCHAPVTANPSSQTVMLTVTRDQLGDISEFSQDDSVTLNASAGNVSVLVITASDGIATSLFQYNRCSLNGSVQSGD